MDSLHESFTAFDSSDYLETLEVVVTYLEATIEEGGDDAALIKRTFGNIARASNFSEIAKRAGAN